MSLPVISGPDDGLSRLHAEPLRSDAQELVSVLLLTIKRWENKAARIAGKLEIGDEQRAIRMVMELKADIRETREGSS